MDGKMLLRTRIFLEVSFVCVLPAVCSPMPSRLNKKCNIVGNLKKARVRLREVRRYSRHRKSNSAQVAIVRGS